MGYRNYSTALGKIVDPNGKGDFTTIQSAIDASTSGEIIYVRPGAYTENITLVAGITLVSDCMEHDDAVAIVGKISASYTGNSYIRGFHITTNGDFAVEVTGAVETWLLIDDCTGVAADSTFINITNSVSTSLLQFKGCTIDITDNTATLFQTTGDAQLNIIECACTDSSLGNNRSTWTSTNGRLFFVDSSTQTPITCTGAGGIVSNGSTFRPNTGAIIPLILSDGFNDLFNTFVGGVGTQESAIQVDNPATLRFDRLSVYNVTNASIVGTGHIIGGEIIYYNIGAVTVTTVEVLKQFPSNIYFNATLTNATANVTGAGTTYTVLFNNELADNNSVYTPATGLFTAPATGNYKFCTNVTLINLGAANTYGQVNLVTPTYSYLLQAGNIGVMRGGGAPGANVATLGGSAIILMSAGETCAVQVTVYNGGGDTVGISNGGQNTFFTGAWQAKS